MTQCQSMLFVLCECFIRWMGPCTQTRARIKLCVYYSLLSFVPHPSYPKCLLVSLSHRNSYHIC